MAQADSRNNPPTEKMQTAAKNAATRHGVELPDNALTDFDVCKAFLDEYLNKPTAKQISFASKIASDKNLTVPAELFSNSRELSVWIDANK